MVALPPAGVYEQSEVLFVRLYIFALHVDVKEIESTTKIPTAHELVHLAEVVGRPEHGVELVTVEFLTICPRALVPRPQGVLNFLPKFVLVVVFILKPLAVEPPLEVAIGQRRRQSAKGVPR